MKYKDGENELTLHISNNTIIRVALFMLLFYMLFYLRELVIVLLVSVIIASSIEPLVKRLEKYKIPRPASALAILAGVLGLFFWIISMFIPIVINEFANFAQNVPAKLQGLSSILGMTPESVQVLRNLFGSPGNAAEVVQSAKGVVTTLGGGLISSTGAFFHTITNIILIFIISFYLSVQEKGIETFIRTLVPKKNEEYAISLWARSQQKIAKWMQGQLILGLIIGLIVYIGLSVMGVPYALLLAVLAGLFELIPVFGPILAMIPAVLLSLSSNGLTFALWVLVFYLIVQQLENNVIVPLVVNKTTGLNSLIVILSLLVGAQVAGFWGILLAVPLVSVFMEYIGDVQKGKGIIQ
jgi:predicted PurR-regulated permease PerM